MNGEIIVTLDGVTFRFPAAQNRFTLEELNSIREIIQRIAEDRSREPEREYPKYAVIDLFSAEAGNYTAEVTGKYASPKSWKPGCLAIPEYGEIYVATGGSYYSGAEEWKPTGFIVCHVINEGDLSCSDKAQTKYFIPTFKPGTATNLNYVQVSESVFLKAKEIYEGSDDLSVQVQLSWPKESDYPKSKFLGVRLVPTKNGGQS